MGGWGGGGEACVVHCSVQSIAKSEKALSANANVQATDKKTADSAATFIVCTVRAEADTAAGVLATSSLHV